MFSDRGRINMNVISVSIYIYFCTAMYDFLFGFIIFFTRKTGIVYSSNSPG